MGKADDNLDTPGPGKWFPVNHTQILLVKIVPEETVFENRPPGGRLRKVPGVRKHIKSLQVRIVSNSLDILLFGLTVSFAVEAPLN